MGEVAEYVLLFLALAALITIPVLFLRRHNDTESNSAPHDPVSQQIDGNIRKSKAAMEDYERQVILDILRDQLAHSRESVSALEEGQDKLIERFAILESKLENRAMALENLIEKVNNRLDNYRYLLSKLEERSR